MCRTAEPQMRVQINQIDYTLEPPGELDSAASHSRVPVIRIYGASSFRETACVHVHQVYPYFFVEYLDTLDPDHGNVLSLTIYYVSESLTSKQSSTTLRH